MGPCRAKQISEIGGKKSIESKKKEKFSLFLFLLFLFFLLLLVVHKCNSEHPCSSQGIYSRHCRNLPTMAVIEPITDTTASSSTRTPLPKPPRRSGDFSYAHDDASAPRDLEATLASWDSIPLFMKDLPSRSSAAAAAAAADPALEALQSLAYDGTPNEVAAQFKSQADEYFGCKRYREALGFYTQAIDANPDDEKLQETLYANRAACNLELHNYGATLSDTSRVLGLNARSEKAYYRATRALIALERYQDAAKCAALGLQVNAHNHAIAALHAKAEQKQAQKLQTQQDAKERESRKQRMAKAVQQALVARGLWIQTTARPPDNPKPVHFDPDCLAPGSRLSLPLTQTWTPPDIIRTPLILPVFWMYPQHAQSDFIPDCHEDTPLSTYLSTMFPRSLVGSLPWDTGREYWDANLHVYATTRKKRLLKLGKKLSLREVMDQAFQTGQGQGQGVADRDGLVMSDGVLSLVVLPKGEAETRWVEQFKLHRDAK